MIWSRDVRGAIFLERVPERGMLVSLDKAVTVFDKKCLHLQTFGMEVIILTAKVGKTKILQKRNRPFSVVEVEGEVKEVAVGVSVL